MNSEQYKGTTTTAESALEYIEYDKIVEACEMIKETATEMREIGNKIDSAGEYCSPNNFCVQGCTYTDSVDECSNSFLMASKGLDEYANSIISALNKAFNIKQDELNENARQQDRQQTQGTGTSSNSNATQQGQQGQQGQQSQPSQSSGQTTPTQPTGSGNSTANGKPSEPNKPAEPTRPDGPPNPDGSKPSEPSKPAEPTRPS